MTRQLPQPSHRPPLTPCADATAAEQRRLTAIRDALGVRPAPTPVATRGPDPAAAHDCPTRTCLCDVLLGGRR